MRYGNRQPIWKKVLSSPFAILLLLILVFVLSRAVSNIGDKKDKIDQRLANVNNEYSKLIERERVLRDRVDFLSTEEGVEAELRSKYRAVADGEKVAVIIQDDSGTSSATTTVEKKRSLFGRIFSIIGL
jgi:cell division protein FtsB